jgi:ribosomal protein L40E
MVKKYKDLQQCIHCGAENPPTAYCCLSCFKILREKHKVPFWRMRIEPTWSALAIVTAVLIAVVVLLKHWMEDIDAQVTMNLQTAENSYSLMADKKKRSDLVIETKSNPVDSFLK